MLTLTAIISRCDEPPDRPAVGEATDEHRLVAAQSGLPPRAWPGGRCFACRGIQILIPPYSSRRNGARPAWDGGLYAFMRRVLETEHGCELYGKRQQIIEPVFGHTKFNRGMDRFHRRGSAAARTEWRLITASHNLLKLWRHTTAPLPA